MSSFITYFLQTAIALSAFYLVYWLFLRKETFFRFNRYYFLVSVVIALIIPFLDVGNLPVFKESTSVHTISGGYAYLQNAVLINTADYQHEMTEKPGFMDYLAGIYLLGVAFLFSRLLFQALILFLKIRNAGIIKMSGSRIVLDEKVNSPFSFFSWIFLNPSQIEGQNISDILLHEKEHIRQKHSFDLFLIELMSAFQWMNPFVWLLRKSLKETHEYLADHAVLKQGVPVNDYQKLLLSYAMGMGHPALITPLNFSLNKKRMIMMKKIKSPSIRKWRSLLLLPVVLILSLAFSNPFSGEKALSEKKLHDLQFVSDSANSLKIRPTPLYIILDGGEISYDKFKSIDPESIKSVTVLSGEEAVKRFGQKAENGVIIITPKEILKFRDVQKVVPDSANSLRINPVPLYIILDGKEISYDKFKSFDPGSIKSINVLKGEAAVKSYGQKGQNGVLIVTSKEISTDRDVQKFELTGKVLNDETGEPMPGVSIVILNTTIGTMSNPEGEFSLQLDEETIVVFSYIGFETAIVNVKNGDKPEIMLKKGVTTLNLDPEATIPSKKALQPEHPTDRNTSGEVFYIVEDMPHFPGGKQALREYISSHIKYPGKAKNNNISGEVYVNFTVDEAGNVKNVFVDNSKSIDPGLDKEAIRVISGMPK